MFYPALSRYLAQVLEDGLPSDGARVAQLTALADFVGDCLNRDGAARLVFICTHNSRRSIFAQVWAQIAARYYGLPEVGSYSGGSEVTACHPNTIAALARTGLVMEPATTGKNPVYLVRSGKKVPAASVFSKHFTHGTNPREGFAAVMTCTQADSACPFVPGAATRLAIPYEDPKVADGTADVEAAYDACCRRICREMMFVFAHLIATTEPLIEP